MTTHDPRLESKPDAPPATPPAIMPTVGRKVWIRGRPGTVYGDQPEDATIIYVHGPRMINVRGTAHLGESFILTSLKLRQPADVIEEGEMYAEWMPYQAKQNQRDLERERAEGSDGTKVA